MRGRLPRIVAVPSPDEPNVRHGHRARRTAQDGTSNARAVRTTSRHHSNTKPSAMRSPCAASMVARNPLRSSAALAVRASVPCGSGKKHIDAVIAEPCEERTARLQIAREHDLRHGARRGGDGNTDIHNNLTVPVRSERLSWIGSCRWRREWPLPPFPADRKR